MQLRYQGMGLVAMMFLGCAADEAPELDATEAVGEQEQEADAKVLALGFGAPVTHRSETHGFGWNFAEQHHYRSIGGRCTPGYERVDVPTCSKNGMGHCEFIGWNNPYNPSDCVANFHVYLPSTGGSEVRFTVLEQRSSAGTCINPTLPTIPGQGPLSCFAGGPPHERTGASLCWCDAGCRGRGDCCPDARAVCGR